MDFALEGHAEEIPSPGPEPPPHPASPTSPPGGRGAGVSYQRTAYNNEKQEWEVWSEGTFGTADTVITLPDIPKPFHYINPDTLRLKLRLTATSSSTYQLFLDELHLGTTYP